MANPYNGAVSQQNRSGGTGHSEPSATKRTGGGALKFRTASWPKVPGKTGPKRNTTGAKALAAYPTSKGL